LRLSKLGDVRGSHRGKVAYYLRLSHSRLKSSYGIEYNSQRANFSRQTLERDQVRRHCDVALRHHFRQHVLPLLYLSIGITILIRVYRTARNATTSSLLRLPIELRNTIWSFLLSTKSETRKTAKHINIAKCVTANCGSSRASGSDPIRPATSYRVA
jgi:hypothetical protein